MTRSIESIKNPDLIQAIHHYVKENKPEKEALLIEEIYRSRFLTPIELEGDVVEGETADQSVISFMTLTSDDGNSYLMAFTDMAELEKWSKDHSKVLAVSYKDLKTLVIGSGGQQSGFVINPFNESMVLTPDVFAYFETIRPHGDPQ